MQLMQIYGRFCPCYVNNPLEGLIITNVAAFTLFPLGSAISSLWGRCPWPPACANFYCISQNNICGCGKG